MTFEEKQKAYMIERMIREKYSFNEELAIQRQRDSKPEEFKEYFVYCEDCKLAVAEQLNREKEESSRQ